MVSQKKVELGIRFWVWFLKIINSSFGSGPVTQTKTLWLAPNSHQISYYYYYHYYYIYYSLPKENCIRRGGKKKKKNRKRKKRVHLRSRYFEDLGCGLGLGCCPSLARQPASQPDRQASSPPQSDELPVRRCCFLCRIRTKIKSFHGAPMSKQQEFDAPDVQVSSLLSPNLSFPPKSVW
jgi:hypothetical protein